MKRNDDTKAKTAMVVNRYGNTTGASKGSKPTPAATVKVRPTGGLKPSGIKMKWEKKF
jgi:hypothetical protein